MRLRLRSLEAPALREDPPRDKAWKKGPQKGMSQRRCKPIGLAGLKRGAW